MSRKYDDEFDPDDTSGKWQQLLQKAGDQGSDVKGDAADDAPPAWLLGQLPALRAAAATIAKALLWRKWSWIAALMAGAVLVIVWLLLRGDELQSPAEPLISPPEEIVSPFDP